MNFLQDWRFFTGLSILFWGLWGFFSKMVGNKLDWGSIFILFGLSSFLIAAISSPQSFSVLFNKMSWIALFAGISGGLGFLLFYQALERGSASLVIPISSLYILVATVLAIIFLWEPLTLRKTWESFLRF